MTLQEADSAPNWLPQGVWVGWLVSEAVEAFVTSLAAILWLGPDTATHGGAIQAG